MIKKISIILILSSLLFGQEGNRMSSDWINVQGRTTEGIKIIIKEETRKIEIYTDKVIETAVKSSELENDKRTEKFNEKKSDLRATLNISIDEKNSIAMSVNDLKDNVALQRSQIMNYRQRISDADSSIENSKLLIMEEKDRVQDELTKIPFYEVLIGRFNNLPPGKSPVPYEDAIASKISREAINFQLGVDIIKKTIIQDGTLSEESVLTLLKGKANTNLTRYEDQRVEKDGKAIYDLYRFGLVAVYPFQDDDVSLSGAKESGIKVDVEVVKSSEQELPKVLDRDNKKQLSNMIHDKKLKNSNSEAQVRRLARTAKQVIKRENGKIKISNGIIDRNRENIVNEEPLLIGDENQLQEYLQDQRTVNNSFMIDQNAYNNHVASEQYVRVFPGSGQATATEEKESRFAEIASNTYEDFTTSIKSEYLKEETKLTGQGLSEIKESQKSDIKLNSIKIVGKFSKKEYGKITLITYVAYNFGFTFEEAPNIAVSGLTLDNIVPDTKPVKPAVKKAKKAYNIKITSNPNADVFIAGQKIGKTPLQYYLDPSSPHGIVLKKKGYQDETDVVSVSAGRIVTKNYTLDKVKGEKVAKKSGGRKWLLYAIVGGGVAYVAMGQKKEGPKTGSLSISISIPN